MCNVLNQTLGFTSLFCLEVIAVVVTAEEDEWLALSFLMVEEESTNLLSARSTRVCWKVTDILFWLAVTCITAVVIDDVAIFTFLAF